MIRKRISMLLVALVAALALGSTAEAAAKKTVRHRVKHTATGATSKTAATVKKHTKKTAAKAKRGTKSAAKATKSGTKKVVKKTKRAATKPRG